MKLVIISDTHGRHKNINLPDGDVLIHCGDVCGRTSENSVRDFAKWFDKQPHHHKLVIAGNHDKHMSGKWFNEAKYLQDSGVEINGKYFYGSPWTPTFFDWYWMKDRGGDIAKVWYKIPKKTDVLITHGPPADCENLDVTDAGLHVGCEELKYKVSQIKPKMHCFGHIHEGYGKTSIDGVDYLNASVCTLDYEPINAPMVYEI